MPFALSAAARAPNASKKSAEMWGTKSTVSKEFLLIDHRRRRRGITIAELCYTANIALKHYERLRSGKTKRPRRATVRALARALDGISPPRPPPSEAVLRAAWRGAVILVATQRGVDADYTLSLDHKIQRPMDRDWMAATHCRRMAMYLVVISLNVSMSALARALGYHKQAISKALPEIEDLRDDAEIDAMLDELGEVLAG